MKYRKSEIAKSFKELEKYGFIVRNLQSNERLGKGMADLTDLIVIGKRFYGDVYFIEIKTTGDKLSSGQKKMKEYLEKSSNYFIVDEFNYIDVKEQILSNTYNQ